MIVRREPLPPDAAPKLAERLARFYRYLSPVYRHPHGEYDLQGMADLDLVVQLLNLSEFTEWLRVHGDATQQRFAVEIAEMELEVAAISDVLGGESVPHLTGAVESLVATEKAHDALVEAVKAATNDEFGDDAVGAVKALAGEAAEAARLREVLVETGALRPADVETDTAALLRALLS